MKTDNTNTRYSPVVSLRLWLFSPIFKLGFHTDPWLKLLPKKSLCMSVNLLRTSEFNPFVDIFLRARSLALDISVCSVTSTVDVVKHTSPKE